MYYKFQIIQFEFNVNNNLIINNNKLLIIRFRSLKCNKM